MPRGSSVGWLGCSRVARVPGSPMVLRKAACTWVAAVTAIRSWLRMILLTAAAISGVMPGATAAIRPAASSPATASSSQSRNAPTVRCEISENACWSWESMISRVTSSVS